MASPAGHSPDAQGARDTAHAVAATDAAAPAITFAIPYHRHPAYLLDAIVSVRAQTFDHWEIIVVDDAGPEPADGVVAALGDDRIRYVRNPVNLGLAGNWNECLRQARAPLVTLLHADDRLSPHYARAVVDAHHADPHLAAVCTDATIIDADGLPTRSLPDAVKRLARRPRHDHDIVGDRDLAAILANNYVFCPSLCYRVALVGAAPFDASWRMVLDLDHIARVLLRGQRMHALRRPLYEYRRHRGNQTSAMTATAERFAEEIALYRRIAGDAAMLGWTRSARAARHRSMVRAHLALQSVTDLAQRRTEQARRKAAMLGGDLRRPR